MASKARLLATSPTIDGIAKLINRYYCSTTYTVTDTLEITRPDGFCPDGVRVIKTSKGYRFEDVGGM